MTRRTTLALAAALTWTAGCVKHIEPYVPKHRSYDLPVPMAAPTTASTGSLWKDDGPAAFWTADLRAARPNDALTIQIDEFSSATGNAATELEHHAEVGANVAALAGLMKSLRGDEAADNLISAVTKNDFEGKGKTSRSGRVLATVPALVRKVLPNGHLFVEGHRVLLINQEEQHFYISGVVRPQDVDTNNRVSSSRIADAQIEITGRGVVSEKTGPGWLARVLDFVWPF